MRTIIGLPLLAVALGSWALGSGPLSAAAPPVFSVTIDKTNVPLGDRVVASYSARIPAGSTIALESLVTPAPAKDALAGGGAVLEFETPAPPTLEKGASADVVTWRQSIAFTPFTAGSISVPGPHFVFVSPSGERIPIRPEPVAITVSSRLPAAQKPEALSPKSDRPTRIPAHGPWFWGSLAALGLLLTALIVWFIRRRRTIAVSGAALVPELPAGAELLAALGRLSAEADVLGSDAREFYSALTHALKRYLERQLTEPVLEWTTFETVRRLRERGTEFPRSLGLPELLSGADQVKFGKAASTRDEARRNLDRARQLHDHLETYLRNRDSLTEKQAAEKQAAEKQAPEKSRPAGPATARSAGERS